jgi:RNA polymerase sigma-70 factor (sigma-E family)
MNDTADEQFRVFVAAQTGPLMRTAYLLTGDRRDAEDLVQSALCTTYLHWRNVVRYDRPEAYVRKVMLNERRTFWRRRRPEQLTADPPERPTQDMTTAVDVRDELWTQLRLLPPRTQAVVVLRYWEDRSEADTADILGCSAGTVKKLAFQGLARLRQHLSHATQGANVDQSAR